MCLPNCIEICKVLQIRICRQSSEFNEFVYFHVNCILYCILVGAGFNISTRVSVKLFDVNK